MQVHNLFSYTVHYVHKICHRATTGHQSKLCTKSIILIKSLKQTIITYVNHVLSNN